MNRTSFVILFLLITSLFGSCTESSDREIDITNSVISIQIDRFEKEIFDPKNIDSNWVNHLQDKYQDLFTVYVERILNFGSHHDPALPMYLDHYTSDIAVNKLYKAVDTSFTNIEEQRTSIENGMKRFNQLFPDKNIPKIATFVNGFTYYNGTVLPKKVFVSKQYLAIGLDMYLGNDFPVYTKLGFPKYFLNTMSKEFIVQDLFKGFTYTEFFNTDHLPDELVYRMIYEGRLLYLVDQLIPDHTLDGICGFTPQQLKWCEDNEEQMWKSIVNNKLLYEKSAIKVDPFFTDGPFTKDFPKESPAKAASWLGYKIVLSYMENNNTGILELMQMNDIKSIFVASKYKPS